MAIKIHISRYAFPAAQSQEIARQKLWKDYRTADEVREFESIKAYLLWVDCHTEALKERGFVFEYRGSEQRVVLSLLREVNGALMLYQETFDFPASCLIAPAEGISRKEECHSCNGIGYYDEQNALHKREWRRFLEGICLSCLGSGKQGKPARYSPLFFERKFDGNRDAFQRLQERI